MKTHLERAHLRHVQTFARELTERDEVDAVEAGYSSARAGYASLLADSLKAFALVGVDELGVRHTIALVGVLPGNRLWVHTAELFKRAGLGALRCTRAIIGALLETFAELWIDVDSQNPALVRLADWLGFKHTGFVQKGGRSWHHAVLRRAAA